eukprot:Clim_evm6s136 gene=Clim_evmTU6s136
MPAENVPNYLKPPRFARKKEGQTGTYSYQESLPSLPVPPLQQTIDLYLNTVHAVCTTEEYENTKRIAEAFVVKEGPKLQEMLEERGRKERNWLATWWDKYAYMTDPEPTPIRINFTGPAEYPFWQPLKNGQILRAGAWVYEIGQLNNKLRTEVFPPDESFGNVMCMNQYRNFYGCARVPGEKEDEIVRNRESSHFAVFCRGHAYKLEAYEPNSWEPRTAHELGESLAAIRRDALSRGNSDCVGALTTDKRPNWARNRKYLAALSEKNAYSLKTIEGSIIQINLDLGSSPALKERAELTLAGDPSNRWFDKAQQLCVYEDGMGGSNGEHGVADAMVMVYTMQTVTDRLSTGEAEVSMKNADYYCNFTGLADEAKANRLDFDVDEKLSACILELRQDFAAQAARVDLEPILFDDFGKSTLRQFKVNPDFFCQQAIQLAYHRLHGKFVATYETAHLRFFYHGRTETVRSCTYESRKFVETFEAFEKGETTAEEAYKAFMVAIKAHQTYMQRATFGQACDRHLFGLSLLAAENGMPTPELFTDPAYTKTGGGGNFVLSTSTTGYTQQWGGFTPMVNDGYGVCYSIQPNSIRGLTTAWKDGKDTNAEKMTEAYMQALRDIAKMVQDTMPPAEPKQA